MGYLFDSFEEDLLCGVDEAEEDLWPVLCSGCRYL